MQKEYKKKCIKLFRTQCYLQQISCKFFYNLLTFQYGKFLLVIHSNFSVSSAKSFILVYFVTLAISLIHKINNSVPKSDPCGTPFFSYFNVECCDSLYIFHVRFKSTHHDGKSISYRSLRYFETSVEKMLDILYSLSAVQF